MARISVNRSVIHGTFRPRNKNKKTATPNRGIVETRIHKVLQNPREVIPVRYGRLAAYGNIEEKKLNKYLSNS